MTQQHAGVLIDLYGCRADEVRILAMALNLMKRLALGDFEYLEKFLEVVLSQELFGESKVANEIKDLIRQANRVLWKERDRWTVFDPKRASVYAVLAHGLERRLAKDLGEADRMGQHLMMERNYNFSEDRP